MAKLLFGHWTTTATGADCVSSFDETAQMLSHAGVDGALERSCAFLFLLK